MVPEGRPERQPAALPRIRKAPTTGHPARHVEPAPEEPLPLPSQASIQGGAVPSELRKETAQTVPLSVRVDASLMKRLRFVAFENETKMQDLVGYALDEWMKQHGY